MEKEKFDQSKYNYGWQKKHAFSKRQIQKEFVNQFREALNKLGLKQSDVFREAMQEVIDKANG